MQALTHKHGDSLMLEIYCLADGKIISVSVDGATGEIKSKKPVKRLGDHG